MIHWKLLIVVLVFYNIFTSTAKGRNDACEFAIKRLTRKRCVLLYIALYPSALRVKRGTVSLLNPTFQTSVEEVNMLYEILLHGLWMDNIYDHFLIIDEELASLRKSKKLEVIWEDVLPRKITEVRRLTSMLSMHVGPLRKNDFERTVLTLVYTAHKLMQSKGHQKDMWAESFVKLYKALKQDLLY